MAVKYFDMTCFPIKCALALDKKSYDAEMRRLKIKKPEEFRPTGVGACVNHYEAEGRYDFVIICLDLAWAKKQYSTGHLRSLVVHEVVHIWQKIEAAMYEKKPSIETEAYFIQWLTKEIWRECKVF